jgi:hypothetical protein
MNIVQYLGWVYFFVLQLFGFYCYFFSIYEISAIFLVLHDVGDDSDAPHVRVEREWLVVDDFRTDEFRSSQHLPDFFTRFDFPAQPEVDQLEQVTVRTF